MIRILPLCLAAAFCSAGCSPGLAAPGPVPGQPGVYPSEGQGRDTDQGEPGDWRSVTAESPVILYVDTGLGDLLNHAPRTGTPIPVRAVSWPSTVHLSAVGTSGLLLASPWIEAGMVRADVRCAGADEPGRRVRVTVEVATAGSGLNVVPEVEAIGGAECELSAGGRLRLRRVAMDVYLWVRSTARTPVSLEFR